MANGREARNSVCKDVSNHSNEGDQSSHLSKGLRHTEPAKPGLSLVLTFAPLLKRNDCIGNGSSEKL
jgi:hypothetical protein